MQYVQNPGVSERAPGFWRLRAQKQRTVRRQSGLNRIHHVGRRDEIERDRGGDRSRSRVRFQVIRRIPCLPRMPLIVPRDELLQMPGWTMEIRGPQGFIAFFCSQKNIVDARWPAGHFKTLLSRLIGAGQGNSHTHSAGRGLPCQMKWRAYTLLNCLMIIRATDGGLDPTATTARGTGPPCPAPASRRSVRRRNDSE